MKVEFKIEYNTSNGEAVHINIGDEVLPLSTADGSLWSVVVDLKLSKISYSYSIYSEGVLSRNEWGKPRQLRLSKSINELQINDRWQEMPSERSYLSSLFTDVLFGGGDEPKIAPRVSGVAIVARACQVERGRQLAMLGSSEILGCWDPRKAVRLTRHEDVLWASPSFAKVEGEYKFAIIDTQNGEVVAWESGENRRFDMLESSASSVLVHVEAPEFAQAAWRGAGVAVPVFSLRSERSMGVGEFFDLKAMVDWASSVGQKIIQILPINDTTMFNTWEDSYPYNANSSFALHPQYICLQGAGELSDKAAMAEFIAEGARLNALVDLDYEAVNRLKNNYLRALFEEIGEQTLSRREFKDFFKANRNWLEPYALFSHLRDKYQTPYFAEWGQEAEFSSSLLKRYTSRRSKDYMSIAYYYFVQYHLHCQLLEVKRYAAQHGVAFKGDVPIGVSRTSVDVWVNPRLFRLDSQAGAPPDDFSALGQNWGFPTYNWDEMAKDNYAWWSARFKKMAEYFDAYRIDHILGFFRIWEIPTSAVHGLLGFFNPSLPFSRDEILEYGFDFQNIYTQPYITDWVLAELFAQRAGKVKNSFLEESQPFGYKLKEDYSSQVQIADKVSDQELREGLMRLLDEVLFIEDRYRAGLYHPRISAYNSFVFRTLSEDARGRYMALYNDFYYQRHNDFWRDNALKKLPELIQSTNMLVCGEDLGMIPQAVPEVMAHEQILSLEIERMPKEPWRNFGDTSAYPYRSVCTTSTHDMNPIRAWWLEDKELTQQYFNCQLGFDGVAPSDCSEYICERIIENHLSSPAMWTILPLQDWLSIDATIRNSDATSERINIPAFPRHYWRYRMHITVEELINASDLNNKIRLLIDKYKR
ncbi:MAG: 4-alpha-glucanotransferase [Rikenellaceae bacterium]